MVMVVAPNRRVNAVNVAIVILAIVLFVFLTLIIIKIYGSEQGVMSAFSNATNESRVIAGNVNASNILYQN